MFSLLTRLIGSKLPLPLRVGLFVVVGIVVAFVFHDVVYGVVLGAIGGFGAWRQGRKTSFAAAPVVQEPPMAGYPAPAAPPSAAPTSGPPLGPTPGPTSGPPPVAPPPAAPEGPSIYGG